MGEILLETSFLLYQCSLMFVGWVVFHSQKHTHTHCRSRAVERNVVLLKFRSDMTWQFLEVVREHGSTKPCRHAPGNPKRYWIREACADKNLNLADGFKHLFNV